MSFQVVIVTPEHQVLDESFESVVLPAHDGQIGLLTDRAPLLVKLGQGPLELTARAGQPPRRFYVEGGIAQMKDNHLTVLTQIAIPAGEISAESARAELAEATAQRVVDDASFEDRQRRMQRARAMEAIATQR